MYRKGPSGGEGRNNNQSIHDTIRGDRSGHTATQKGARVSARVGQNQQGQRGSNSATVQQTFVILPNQPPNTSHDPLVEAHVIRKVDGVSGRVVGVGVVGNRVVGDRVEIDSVGMNESCQLWHVGLAVGRWSLTCKAKGIQG